MAYPTHPVPKFGIDWVRLKISTQNRDRAGNPNLSRPCLLPSEPRYIFYTSMPLSHFRTSFPPTGFIQQANFLKCFDAST